MTEENTVSEQLLPGLVELTEPIRLSGARRTLRGTKYRNVVGTRIRRGRNLDGSLYDGPLILVEDCDGVEVRDLIIEGARYGASQGRLKDERHPLTCDRSSPRFPCGREVPEPGCYERASFGSNVAADLLVMDSTNVEISGLTFESPVRFGIAIGRATSQVAIRRCAILGAGDFGIWAGAGVDPEDAHLPLAEEYVALMPRHIEIDTVTVERCGSAGIYLEARNTTIVRSRLIQNCHDAPYNDEGGQLTIEYKSHDIRVAGCAIVGGLPVVRRGLDGKETIIGSFGVEACGSNLTFDNTLIEGNSREGVQIMGARNVDFSRQTRIVNNHLAQQRYDDDKGDPRRCGITISTTAAFSSLGAVVDDIRLDDVTCENGMAIWSDGSVPDMTLETLSIRNSDLGGTANRGVSVGDNAEGGTLRGGNWSIDGIQ